MNFKFNPTHKTKDGVFLIDLDYFDITKVEKQKPEPNFVADNVTNTYIQAYNTKTERLSSKVLYFGKQNKLYFKSGSHWGQKGRYYIDELVEIDG